VSSPLLRPAARPLHFDAKIRRKNFKRKTKEKEEKKNKAKRRKEKKNKTKRRKEKQKKKKKKKNKTKRRKEMCTYVGTKIGQNFENK
jgi:hypothetical protein